MSLGVCMSHKLGDAFSISLFLNNWAAITSGNNTIICPKFDMTSLFPPKDVPYFIPPFEITEKIVSKRFVFEASNIAALRVKSSNSLYVGDPTRVELVSALIWRCTMKAARMRLKLVKPSSSVVILPVNLRGRVDPPMTNMSVGNVVIFAIATSTTETISELHCLLGQLRNTIKKIDNDYVRNIKENDGISAMFDSAKEIYQQATKGELDHYAISSWCRIPFYEADFGGGKPVWIGSVGSVNLSLPNAIMLMDTKDGNGIEAWVSLYEEDMVKFECDPELITFTSSNQVICLET